VYDLNDQLMNDSVALGATKVSSLDELVAKLPQPRVVWVMLPHGAPTEGTIARLSELVAPEDTLVDGGNCNYKKALHHAAMLKAKGIRFLDIGTSNGVWGNELGYGMMIGGDAAVVQDLRPALESLAPDAKTGWGRVGPSGAGHYVKTIHNGMEYGVVQALAEGFALMERKRSAFDLDVAAIIRLWNGGSVMRSFLLELAGKVFAENPALAGVEPFVVDNGTGQWFVEEGIETQTPTPMVALALMARYESRIENSVANRFLALLRNKFGGHDVKQS
jgi:6-phosphogluconate dehydrogenase